MEPPKLYNRPGLPALAYRIGDYTSFKSRLLTRLSNRLRKLSTRASDDPAIALLDAWAVVGDILTFYTERIANEGYLNTATERLSVLELARTIGYELTPGVAASTFLAFTVEDTPGSPGVATVPKGTQVMSIPGEDEVPQTFETSEEIIAYADWNAIKPRQLKPQEITSDTRKLYFKGINTQLQAGDRLLLIDGEQPDNCWYLLTLAAVETVPEAGYTRITWEQHIEKPPRNPKVFAFRQQAALFGNNAPNWQDMPDEIKRTYGGTIQGGIFRTDNNGNSWESINTGLPNIDIRCLAINQSGYIFAGTPSGGIFRSTDNGNSWMSINAGLMNMNVQTIFINDRGHLFSGTSNGGVFRSTDNGDNWTAINVGTISVKSQGENNNSWESINTSLPNTVVRSLVSYTINTANLGTGTISSTDVTVTRNQTGATTEIAVGDTIIAAGQIRKVIKINSTTSLTLDAAFSQDLSPGTIFYITTTKNYIFAGTEQGIYRSEDLGKNWILKGLPNKSVNCLLITNSQWGTGRISSSGTIVTGNETAFNKEFKIGDAIAVANNQTRTVTQIDSELTIDAPFQRNVINESFLITSRNYLFAATDDGIYRSNDDGESWELINRGIINNNIQALAVNQKNRYLFAGTDNGVFRSINNGNNWELINNQPVQALVVNPRNENLFAATKSGIMRYNNEEWETVNQGLTTKDITSIAVNANGEVFAGSNFAGFVEKDEWPNFEIKAEQIDLDTLYSPILPDSWIVLLDESQSKVKICKVKDVSTHLRSDYTLSTKVTSIEPTTTVNTSEFKLRDTVVLIKSEQLELASEPLTVLAQQHQIFFAPIIEKKILLSEFVQGLELDKTIIVSGKRIRAKINNIGGVFHSLDNGSNWERINTGLTNTGVTSLLTSNNILFAGTNGDGVFRSTNNGENWTPINTDLTNTDITSLVAYNQQGTEDIEFIFAGTAGGGIFRYTNDRNNWQQVNTGLGHTNIRTIAVNQSNGYLFAGTVDGGVFISTNSGENWSQTSLTNTDVQAIAMKPNGHILAGTAKEGVFRSEDNGSSWQQINTGLRNRNVTALTSNMRDRIFAGTADGGMFRFINEGEKWEQINNNLMNMNIRCLAANSSNGYIFAGTASGGVFRSTNDGELWTPINTGLNNTDIRAIAIHDPSIFAGGIGILISSDGSSHVELKIGDLLQVIAPPFDLESNNPKSQQWHLMDRNGVEGNVIVTTQDDISLQPATDEDAMVSEVSVIEIPPNDQQRPVLTLKEPLKNSYDPTTTIIYGNVVGATHGETVIEVLGSGDGTVANQSFILKKPPLTYVSAPTPSGVKSTLEVRVNDVLWEEVSSLDGLNAFDQNYIVRIDDDGTTTVIFGDGKKGARLPSGEENVVATYRSGIGTVGKVAAGSLTLLKTRPLGILEVINPLAATGAADREVQGEARASAPLTVTTLDRIVSLQDFQDFARAFPGIGKAQAVVLWNGETQLVHMTVAALGGGAVERGSILYDNLVKAIDAARDPIQMVQVDSCDRLLFNLEAKVLVDNRYAADNVMANVRNALMETFAFAQRAFGQAVTASEAIAAIQSIEGVVAVDLDALYRFGFTKTLEQSLSAATARVDVQSNKILPAQLLLLNRNGINLTPG